jgi:hypothetical protein
MEPADDIESGKSITTQYRAGDDSPLAMTPMTLEIQVPPHVCRDVIQYCMAGR